jgi:hypothetical protein
MLIAGNSYTASRANPRQDIGAEPNTDAKLLHKESQRLLALPE